VAGGRRLIWQKRNGRWLIVEDHFPTQYTPVK
jgi:ketosteroid isomerase-like protein